MLSTSDPEGLDMSVDSFFVFRSRMFIECLSAILHCVRCLWNHQDSHRFCCRWGSTATPVMGNRNLIWQRTTFFILKLILQILQTKTRNLGFLHLILHRKDQFYWKRNPVRLHGSVATSARCLLVGSEYRNKGYRIQLSISFPRSNGNESMPGRRQRMLQTRTVLWQKVP